MVFPCCLPYYPLPDHELFLSFVIVSYKQDFFKKPIINFGRIYILPLYREITTENCRDEIHPQSQFQLKPLSNFFYLNVKKDGNLVVLALDTPDWYNISGVAAKKYQESVFDLSKKLPKSVLDALYEDLKPVTNAEKAFEIFIKHFEEFIPKWNQPKPLDQIVKEFFKKQGAVNPPEIAWQFPYAESNLRKYFNKYIGYSPKFFCRLIHFNRIIREIEANGKWLSELIRQYNFYAYAHFKGDLKFFERGNPQKI